MTELILALDQGTTSSRAIVFDRIGVPVAAASAELPQHYPSPGWVEHDPEVIARTQLAAARDATASFAGDGSKIAAIGIANQRETTILWDRRTGKPIHNAIVWQDRRTAALCDDLRAAELEPEVRARTGLVIDPYFSATKIRWLLDDIPGLQARAERGEIAFGTVDSYLIYRLTDGRLHVTDVTNASRTMLYNLHTLDWDDDLLRELRIPRAMLPEVRPSSGDFGETDRVVAGRRIKIAGVAGDQQAALFGQACLRPGATKQTYGTGSFMLMQTGTTIAESRHGLISTIACQIDGRTTYALEGSSFVAGAAIQWLRDEIGFISTAAESAAVAASVATTDGVYFVPAFVGLGAPFWDPHARGAIVGMTRGTGRAQIVRAVLEAIAFQTRDLAMAMAEDSGVTLSDLRVDGGMAANETLMQLQSDLLGCSVSRPVTTETTALGAAFLAGLAVGLWSTDADIGRTWRLDRTFLPSIAPGERDRRHREWLRAVERARGWAVAES